MVIHFQTNINNFWDKRKKIGRQQKPLSLSVMTNFPAWTREILFARIIINIDSSEV
jgi:hypothetical protein